MKFLIECAYNPRIINIRSKMRGKILTKHQGGRKQKVKIRYLVAALILASGALIPQSGARAESCPDVRVVFARGSGGERWTDQNYLEFKSTIETKLTTTSLDYEFVDLDYPAVGVGIDKIDVTVGAFLGAGDAYEFGESVGVGVDNLSAMVNGASCPGTKYVIGGYSQGAMVVSRALGNLNAERLIYAATFGDPKLYLPEGEGLIPAACRGENLSDYRMYVPDCQAYKGLLGAYIPYEPEALVGKVGTWCNKRDVFCSSHLSISDHTAYIAENLYEDASRVIFAKIAETFGLENRVSSPHDTAILIDSTGSMADMLEQYKNEALRLATETVESGGRIALFDYRDLADPYDLVQHCSFENCTLEVFERELQAIQADGGGDDAESLLSASFHTMEALNWKQGSTKSLVILTDANFLSPDRDGMSFDEVVALSKRIDPVNFYIITKPAYGDTYEVLASATDGKVMTDFDELSLLTDYIMERYDSLPRVEESGVVVELPELSIAEVAVDGNVTAGGKARVKISSTGPKTLVALNDAILGLTADTEIVIEGLDLSKENILTLVPIGEDRRGMPVAVSLSAGDAGVPGADGVPGAGMSEAGANASEASAGAGGAVVLVDAARLKAPETGKR